MRKLTIIALIIACFTTCKKEDSDPHKDKDDTPSTGKFLAEVKYWDVKANTAVTIRKIEMMSDGRITSIRTYSNSTKEVIWEFTTITRDANNGRVIKVTGTDKISNEALVFSFVYNAKGNLAQSSYTKGGVAQRSTSFLYDSSDRIIQLFEVNTQTQATVRKLDYTYTGTSENPASYTDGAKTYTLKFDDKKNPSQAALSFLMGMGLTDIYKANLLESNNGTTTTTNTVTYNKDGFAVSTTNGSGSGLKYFYEY